MELPQQAVNFRADIEQAPSPNALHVRLRDTRGATAGPPAILLLDFFSLKSPSAQLSECTSLGHGLSQK